MNDKHTPGPWYVTPMSYGYRVTHAYKSFTQTTITTVCRCDDEADARLIATAPELLKALQAILDGNAMAGSGQWSLVDVIQKHYQIAREAIRKATEVQS